MPETREPLRVVVTPPVKATPPAAAPITLSQPVAANSAAASFDVLQIKKSLNRLGDYTPPADIGITDIPDSDLFTAIKKFQKDMGLDVTGIINPDDKTLAALNAELIKPQTGYYVWHCVHDDHVRAGHAVFDGTIRNWEDFPDPGEDFNCRCWAEPIEIPKDIQPALNNAMETLKEFNDKRYTLSAKLLQHYLGNTGNPIELKEKELENLPIVKSAILKNRERFEDSFTGKSSIGEYYKPNSFYRALVNLSNNGKIRLSDYWDVDISWKNLNVLTDPDFSRAIGSGKIRSIGNFELSRKGDIVRITGKISHQINDVYDFNSDTAFDRGVFANERLLATKNYAKPFAVNWQKDTPFSGTIILRNNRVISADFK